MHSTLHYLLSLISGNPLLPKNIEDAAITARATELEVNFDALCFHCQ